MNNRMHIGQENALKDRVKKIETLLNTKSDINLIQERNEIQFKINKQEVNFKLVGKNKYYYAHQCALFQEYVWENGFGHISAETIKDEAGVCFNDYSINTGYNQYGRDLKRFNSKQEMLGFVIGYNQAIENNA